MASSAKKSKKTEEVIENSQIVSSEIEFDAGAVVESAAESAEPAAPVDASVIETADAPAAVKVVRRRRKVSADSGDDEAATVRRVRVRRKSSGEESEVADAAKQRRVRSGEGRPQTKQE